MAVQEGSEIAITRIFDAPRETVWRAFTDSKLVAKWWGPNGFTNTIQEMDVRPGGTWRFIMHSPEGKDYENRIVYKEIMRPERIVFEHVTGPRFQVTMTLAEEDGKTRLTYRMVFSSTAELERAIKEFHAVEGLNQTMGRLGNQLEAC